MAADVLRGYAAHRSRGNGPGTPGQPGGCTGYSVESLLGLRLNVDKLRFFPCLPDEWRSFKLHYRYRDTFYHINFTNNGGREVIRVVLNHIDQPDKVIHLVDDRQEHAANVEIG